MFLFAISLSELLAPGRSSTESIFSSGLLLGHSYVLGLQNRLTHGGFLSYDYLELILEILFLFINELA